MVVAGLAFIEHAALLCMTRIERTALLRGVYLLNALSLLHGVCLNVVLTAWRALILLLGAWRVHAIRTHGYR